MSQIYCKRRLAYFVSERLVHQNGVKMRDSSIKSSFLLKEKKCRVFLIGHNSWHKWQVLLSDLTPSPEDMVNWKFKFGQFIVFLFCSLSCLVTLLMDISSDLYLQFYSLFDNESRNQWHMYSDFILSFQPSINFISLIPSTFSK